MTERQKRFVDEYIATGNSAEACRRAGYTTKNTNVIGPKNLAKPEVKAAITARLKELESERIANTTEVLERLTSILRGEEVEYTVTPSGKTIKTPPKIGDRLRAAEHLLKVSGAFKEKLDVKLDAADLFTKTLLKISEE